MSEAAAQFKKQDGKLAVSADGRTVSWKASSGSPAVDIAVTEISSMYLQRHRGVLLLVQDEMLTTPLYRSPADACDSRESIHQSRRPEVARAD